MTHAMTAHIDHLVVMADSLAQGVRWCEEMLGITPGPGGRHVFMGTHNRLIRIDSPAYPLAYLEIIAIDPQAPAPAGSRWFDMDDPALRARIAAQGPALTHFVVRVDDALQAVRAWQALGIEPGAVVPAARETARGRLEWKITLREDGRRLFDGALPTLIEWGPVHPASSLEDSGIQLESLTLIHRRQADLQTAFDAIGLAGVSTGVGPPALCATLRTPQGLVRLA